MHRWVLRPIAAAALLLVAGVVIVAWVSILAPR